MAGTRILVLGATGPTGINVLRELIYRQVHAVVYARNPSKMPRELSSSPYIEIIQGEFKPSDEPALSRAIAQCSAVISLLGPVFADTGSYHPTFFADIYTQQIVPLMLKHSVSRIFVMGTISIRRPEDSFHFLRWLNSLLIKLLFGGAQKNMFALESAFEGGDKDIQSLDWTIYRMVWALGGCDERTWRKERDDAEMFAGPVGAKGFTMIHRRAQLARWLVDVATAEGAKYSHQMPAVSRLAGSGLKSA